MLNIFMMQSTTLIHLFLLLLQLIDLDICQIFKDCCDLVSEKTLKGALHSLNEWEMFSHSYTAANSSQQVSDIIFKMKSYISFLFFFII